MLLTDEGLINTEIAEHVPLSAHAVGRWRKVKNRLKRNKRVTLNVIPKSLSWLNLVESFFGLF